MIARMIIHISLLMLPNLFRAAADRNIGFPSPATDHKKYDTVRSEVAGVIANKVIQDDPSSISLSRDLGDFDELNDLFEGLVLALPDLYVEPDKFLGATVRLWVTNLRCGSLKVDDIVIDYGLKSNTRFDFNVDIFGLDISCTLDWRYKWSFASGSGKAQVYTDNNSAQTSIRFNSEGYDQHPPSGTSVDDCISSIKITDMDFQGGILASIVDIFEKGLRGTVSNEIEKSACDELGSLGTTLVEDLLGYVYELIESYLVDLPPQYKDVLNAENELVIPDEVELINYTDFGSTLGTDTMGTLFQTGLRLLDETLGTMVADPDADEDADIFDLGINILLRKVILDDERAFAVNITDLPDFAESSGIIFEGHDMLTETVIILEEVKLFGLDTFENFDPLNSAGQYTLGNNFFWEHLRAEFSLTLIMKPSTKSDSIIGVGTDVEVRESITVSIAINDIDVDFHLLLGIDENELGELQLGSMLNTSNIVPCLLPSLFTTEISGFSASVDDMEPPVLSGFLSPGIDRLVSNAADAVFIMYESTLIKALPNFFELTVRNITNEAILSIVDVLQDNSTCIRFEENAQDQVLHLGDLLLSKEDAIQIGGSGEEPYGTVIRDALSLLRGQIQAINSETNTLYMNEVLVRNFTNNFSGIPGSLVFSSDIFNSKSEFSVGELTAAIELRMSDAQIDNVDSFGLPLSLLEPTSGSVLNNTVVIGATDKPLIASSQLKVGFSDGKDINVSNVMDLGLEISNATIQVDALITVLESRLLQFPIEDINNIDCWLSMIPAPALDSKGVRQEGIDPTLALQQLKIVMESVRLQINCVECSSPKIQEMAETLVSDEAIEDISKLANGAINYISGLLGGTFLQVKFDRMLADAAKRCPHNAEFVSVSASNAQYLPFDEPETSTSKLGMILTFVSILGVLALSVFMLRILRKVMVSRHYKKWISNFSEDEIIERKKEQLMKIEKQKLIDSETLPMVKNLAIPTYIRFGVPLLIITNIGFFLSGHLSLGASVDIDAQIGGEIIRIKQLFVFSMAESVLDMWEAGAKELAILIALLSGVWPYTKQLTVMYLWFAPSRLVSVRRRESLLLWLDALGKWSFVDIFVLIMSVPSFRVSISSPDNVSFLPPELYSLNLLVIPCWGLYSNMIAQILSQFTSHLIIHCHRKILHSTEGRIFGVEEDDDEARPRLCSHKFKTSGMGGGPAVALRNGANRGLVVLALVFVAFLLAGVIVPSFSLSQFGLVGLVVETSPGQTSYVDHNVFSIIALLMRQAKFTGMASDYVGLSALSVIFIVTVIIVPLLQLGLLLRRWFGNLDKKARLRNFVVVEALQSWQYMEVYMFSIVIACWQLGSVSEFLINDYCASFDELFNSLAYYGILRPVDSQCFKVEANLQPGTLILIAASVFLLILNRLISSAAKQQENDIKTVKPEVAIHSGSEKDSLDDVRVEPPPATFSDNYRWLLRNTDE